MSYFEGPKELFRGEPCTWSIPLSYLYVRRYGGLPEYCLSCYKILAFFAREDLRERFAKFLKDRMASPGLPYLPKCPPRRRPDDRYVLVMYTRSVRERFRLQHLFWKVREECGVACNVNSRRAGRYWEDLFPELFDKELESYEPFYEDIFEFRKVADKIYSEKLKLSKMLEELMRRWIDLMRKPKTLRDYGL